MHRKQALHSMRQSGIFISLVFTAADINYLNGETSFLAIYKHLYRQKIWEFTGCKRLCLLRAHLFEINIASECFIKIWKVNISIITNTLFVYVEKNVRITVFQQKLIAYLIM